MKTTHSDNLPATVPPPGQLYRYRITCNRARAIDRINPGSTWLIAHLMRPDQRITLNHPELIRQSLCVSGCL